MIIVSIVNLLWLNMVPLLAYRRGTETSVGTGSCSEQVIAYEVSFLPTFTTKFVTFDYLLALVSLVLKSGLDRWLWDGS